MRQFVTKAGIVGVVAVFAVVAFSVTAQAESKRHKISWNSLAANTKYTQQHVIEAGDVPGHQIRIFEIHTTYPTDPPIYEGVRVKETWARGYSDYIDINGRAWGYAIDILENGDKLFSQWSGTSQTIVNPDGSKKSIYTGVGRFTGGTGRFRGIRGMTRDTAIFDPQTGYNEGKTEGEYWIED